MTERTHTDRVAHPMSAHEVSKAIDAAYEAGRADATSKPAISEQEQALWTRVFGDELQRLLAGVAAGHLKARDPAEGNWEACAANAAKAADAAVALLRERMGAG